MGIEYIIHADKVTRDVLSLIFESIKNGLPQVQCSVDESSLWIRSIDPKHADPKWIAFSIEKSGDGLFILSNLNGTDSNKIFSLIESALMARGVGYSIEEI